MSEHICSQIFGDCLELIDIDFGRLMVIKAMIDMVMNQCSLGLHDRFFDSMQLLRDIETSRPAIEHRNHAPEVAICAL